MRHTCINNSKLVGYHICCLVFGSVFGAAAFSKLTLSHKLLVHSSNSRRVPFIKRSDNLRE